MSACQFCGRKFANRQAVKAHLKSCAAYRSRRSAPSRRTARPQLSIIESNARADGEPDVPAEDPDGSDLPLRQLQRRLSSERIRLQLRELDAANEDLNRQAEAKRDAHRRAVDEEAQAARTAAQAEQEARRSAEEAAARQERREAAEHERQAKRRNAIQEVKRQVVDDWFGGFLMPSDLKPRIRIAIEKALEPLPVEELPLSELVQLAEGIRDNLYREVKAGVDQAAKHTAQRERLIQHGIHYAERELREIDGLDVLARWRIERLVKDELAAVTGEETTDDIEDWVDEILEDEGIGWDDEDD